LKAASTPAGSTILAKPAVVNGALRSDRNTNSYCGASRCSRLRARSSTPASECVVDQFGSLQHLKAIEKAMLATHDQQISLTDPDSRSMATSGRGSGVVGYNVQVAVDTAHHLIVTHKVTNTGADRAQLANIASQAIDILC
jgi:hypothetical protein